MNNNSGKIREFYDVLYSTYGSQNWWPAETVLECILGTILTQNTSWTNAAKAIYNLKSFMELTVNNLNDIPFEELTRLIRPAGYFNVKAKRIKSFINFLIENYRGDLDAMFETGTEELRKKTSAGKRNRT